MPYTLSHPAAVLFLGRRRWSTAAGPLGLPLAAAVAGSMAPDIPYYLKRPGLEVSTHSLMGLFTVDLLIGLALYFVWIELILRPALWLAPVAVQRRVPEHHRITLATRLASPRALFAIVACVLFGSLTHLVWDSFTHAGMWGTTRWPTLSAQVSGHTVYTWLQFTSSILGLVLIARALVTWWSRTPPTARPVPGRTVWRVLVAVCLIVIPLWESLRAFRRFIRAPFGWSWLASPATQSAIIEALLRGTKVGLSLILAFSLLWHLEARIRAMRYRWRPLELPQDDSGSPVAAPADQREPEPSRTSH